MQVAPRTLDCLFAWLLSVGPPIRRTSFCKKWAAREEKMLVLSAKGRIHGPLRTKHDWNSCMQLLFFSLLSLDHSTISLLYVPTYAHTRTIKMWRTRRCSGTHAHPSIHEEGQRFEQAPHVTSVHGVSEMPALTPRQDRSWTILFRELWVLEV